MMNHTVQNILLLLLFVASVVLVVVGQKNIGYAGLSAELIGLAGVISVLYIYNKRYK